MSGEHGLLRIARLEPYVHPFTGRRVTRTRCGICGAWLPLPGEYRMMRVRHEPEAELYDLTRDPEPGKKPPMIQKGITVWRPVCRSHIG